MHQQFQVLKVALELITTLRPVCELVQQHDRDLAAQLRRAASSVPLCISEGAQRVGRDRLHLWRVAAGSAAEVRTGLAVAAAWGYVAASDAANTAALGLLDRIIAMLWRLTHPSPRP